MEIHIKGKIKKSIPNFAKETVDACRLQGRIKRYAFGVFRDFVSFEQDENTLYATLHPCEEPVIFKFDADIIICSATTSNVGPGYHAYVVELIEKLGDGLNIQWKWNKFAGAIIPTLFKNLSKCTEIYLRSKI